jgi:surfactin synthase thioesterase subunit
MAYRVFSNWITCARPRPNATLRLFCLPFAGGGASAFRSWPSGLPATVEVCPVQLPGREERYAEPARTDLVGIAHAISRELTPYLDKPFAFFGHSLGALLAFEVSRSLRRTNGSDVAALFLSAYPAPQTPRRLPPIHLLSDQELIAQLRRFEGTPEVLLQDPELLAFALPTLRADFQACDTYDYSSESPLACPIVMYGGTDDTYVGAGELEPWREHSSASFELHMLPGNHLFVQSQREALLDDLGTRLTAQILNVAGRGTALGEGEAAS